MKVVKSMQAFEYKKDSLYFNEVPLATLTRKYKGPTFYYFGFMIRHQISKLKQSLPKNTDIFYAMKANHFKPLLQLLRHEGLGIDAVSGGEIQAALNAGFRPEKIIFSGVGKTTEEISFGIQKNIRQFNVESIPEILRIGQIAARKKKSIAIHIRINPNVNAKTHPYITTGLKDNKFGLELNAVPHALEAIKKYKKNIVLKGLSFHIGSQIMSHLPLIEALEKSSKLFMALKNLGYPLSTMDVGGGIGVDYKGDKKFPIEKYGSLLNRTSSKFGYSLQVEPGRFLVAESGILLSQVQYIKTNSNKNFVILDSGMNHFMRPTLYDAFHHILPLQRRSKIRHKYDVVGPICESSDFFAKGRSLTEIKQDDFLVIADVGAYGSCMQSSYNLRNPAREILIK